mgnify:CR=1 FL=1|jgi:hypothetical protein
MPTNEEMRRASGLAMENNRRASGQAMENNRRAGGQAMIAQRTGKAVAADINVLTNPQKNRKTLSPIQPVGALPASRGRGVYKPPASTGTGSIASPLREDYLVEESAETESGLILAPKREYWPDGLISSDGLFVLPAIKTLNLIDANGNEVQVNLMHPLGVPFEPK